MLAILPSILTDDAETFRERLTFAGFWRSDMTAHIDILDGSMFGATCFCDPMAICPPRNTSSQDVSFPTSIELHCMIRNPLPVIQQWKTLIPQTVRAIIHAEIDRPIDTLSQHIHNLNMECGIAFCPKTSADLLHRLSELPDRVLLMGVEPGTSGQPFLGDIILAKIQRLRAQHASLHISVDGGITPMNAPHIFQSGASSVVTASAIWNTPNPRESYEHIVHRVLLHEEKKI